MTSTAGDLSTAVPRSSRPIPTGSDHILFYEYFHGDNGAGLGASHQTGWTGLVSKMIELFGRIDGEQLLAGGRAEAFAKEETQEHEHAEVA